MAKNHLTIGLYGIGGVYNYGCEAIVRGTEIILHQKWPDARIKYASLRPEDDAQRLEGCDVEIVPRKMHRFGSIERFNSILAYLTGFHSKRFFPEDLKWVDDCDVVLSIGGDLYTIPPGYQDPKIRCYNPLIHFGDLVKNHEKKFVVWGASVGPFEDCPRIKKRMVEHLRRVDLITSREPETSHYLEYLGLENFIECADPAFMISSPEPVQEGEGVTLEDDVKREEKVILNDSINGKKENKLHIGINLSPLSSIYMFKKDMKQVIKDQADLVTSLIEHFDARVTLIPHVVCHFNVDDDDLRYLKQVQSMISDDVKGSVELLDGDIGFLKTKEVLSTCDCVIAARMHCAINAVSVGVPTIFLAYSKKAYGMVEYVYGNRKWVVSLKDVNNTNMVSLINEIMDAKPHLFDQLHSNLEQSQKTRKELLDFDY
ncbi:polysaccharide pyruvyl transferase family protein [Methanobacterium petrolearium]|uniref:polysaccharide pyruvyl transferase family protein n=1 Tax=Methanobacterium petrolearium TaxID=710190 RepID=UPI001AE56360|nr:polysaccharide pyruvyl transferase family protein [Methanobacterium petrolearium]MBP1945460.1 polysaccharide pyruvyl transferase WcaK-like protein [Methanobacterium petrolearium]BDZ71664.1 hypothetical protein GCM10025861_21810 [Methanobacterium petrolearium]